MNILMTGITGLVGAAFTTALLRENPSFRIVSLCRGFCGTSGKDRAEKVIREQCELDGKPETADDIISRVTIVEGTLENFPADELASHGPFDTFFHCAASVNLGKDLEGKTYRTNFGGTESAIALAKRIQVKSFHYVSTAYVAGKCSGTIMEDSMPATDFNNSYEKSKYNAEKLVRESGFPYTVYRPAIVTGRLSDGVVRKPLAFYRLLEFMAMIKKRVCLRAHIPLNASFETSLRMESAVSDKIYFVPVDYVQKVISKLFLLPCTNTTYHVTGSSPVSVDDIRDALCSVLKAKGLEVLPRVEDPSAEEKLVQKMMGDLMPYFASDLTFDQTNVRKALGDEVLNWKMGIDYLRKMIYQYYLREVPEIVKD